MTIINPNSIAGITSVTAEADVMNFYKSNGTLGSLQLNGCNFNTTNGISTFNNLVVGGTLTYEDVKNVDSVGVITARGGLNVTANTDTDTLNVSGISTLTGAVYIKNTYPRLYLQDTDSNSDFSIINSNGAFMVYDDTNSANRFTINSSGIGAFNSDLEVAGSHYITDSIIHTGDTNTKIRFPAADTITAETGGSERLRIKSDGKVGINTVSPARMLHIFSGTTGHPVVLERGDTSNTQIELRTGGATRGYWGCSTAANFLVYDNDTSHIHFTVNQTGKVGIGENTPLGNLHVKTADSGASVGSSADELVLENSSNTGMTILSGTTGEGGINFGDSGDVNQGRVVYMHNGDYMHFHTNSAERLRIDSSGKVGINETSPLARLHVKNGESSASGYAHDTIVVEDSDHAYLTFLTGTSGGAGINFGDSGSAQRGVIEYAHSSDYMRFITAQGERLRIDSSGRLLVASTTSRSIWGANPQTQIEKLDSNAALSIIRNSNTNAGPWIALCKSRGTANGAVTIVQDGDSLGSIDWFGADGGDLANVSAEIKVEIDGTPGSNDLPGRILFKTTADGAASPTERLRITAGGYVNIGGNYTQTTDLLQVNGTIRGTNLKANGAIYADANANTALYLHSTGTTGQSRIFLGDASTFQAGKIVYDHTNDYMMFGTGGSGTERLRIDSSGSLLIGSTSNNGASNAGQTPVLYANGYCNLGGLRIKGGDDGNTIYKDGGDLCLVTASAHSIILKTAGGEQIKANNDGRVITTTNQSVVGLLVKNSSHDSRLQIYAEAANKNSTIWFGDAADDDIGIIDYDHNNNSMSFTTNTSERLRIASNGSVGVNITNPQVYDPAARALVVGEVDGYGHTGMTIASNGTDKQGAIYFADGTGSSSYRGRIEYNHNDDSLRFGTAGGGNKINIDTNGSVTISSSQNEKMILSGTTEPYIRWQESTTDKAYIQWRTDGYLQLTNMEDQSYLRVKDTIDFSEDGTDFHRVHHDDYFGHWGDDYTSVWVGTQNASTTVRDDEKDKWYRIEISEASWSGGCNTLDIVRANVHQNSAVHGNWYGSLDARIQFRTSHCGHGANYVRWVHHYSSSPPSGGFIGKTNAYLSCGESSRMIVWLRGQASYQIRVNGRKAHVRTSDGGSTQGGPDNTSQINATELWDPITSIQASSVMAIGNDRYWYAKSLRYGGQGATDAGVKCDAVAGGISVTGDVSATGNKPFRIPHPLVGLSTTKDLIHTAVEGPQADLIYRGKVDLVSGTVTVNLDTKTGMTEGTFVALNRDVQCFTTNETGWTNVKGSVSGNILTITAQDSNCTDTISWMVVGERQDDKIKESLITDSDGHLLLEVDQEPITEEDFGGTSVENQTDEQVSIMNSMMN